MLVSFYFHDLTVGQTVLHDPVFHRPRAGLRQTVWSLIQLFSLADPVRSPPPRSGSIGDGGQPSPAS